MNLFRVVKKQDLTKKKKIVKGVYFYGRKLGDVFMVYKLTGLKWWLGVRQCIVGTADPYKYCFLILKKRIK